MNICTHATAHTIITYYLCLSTVKDDRYEKEERKTKHEMYTVALKQLYTVKTSNVQEEGGGGGGGEGQNHT